MRYIINDDEFEEWYMALLEAQKALKNVPIATSLDYVIDEMEGHLETQFTPEQIQKHFKDKA